MTARFELTAELDRVVCAVAIRQWRPGGVFDLDDLKQQARLAALEALPKHDGRAAVPGFVANAARWRIADMYKREETERRHRHESRMSANPHHAHREDYPGNPADEILDERDLIEEANERIDAQLRARDRRIVDALRMLAPAHRQVLEALYLAGEDRSYRIVAAEMRISVAGLKSRRRRALHDLRRIQQQHLAA